MILPIEFCSVVRCEDSGLIGTICFHGFFPTRLVEKSQTPTDHLSSKSCRPPAAAFRVTSARVAPLAVGTVVSIDPETSKTARTRPGTVTAAQLPSTWLSELASSPAAALPPAVSPPGPEDATLGEAAGAPSGGLKPAPAEPSGARRPEAARAFLKAGVSSWACRPAAAADFCRSTSGMTAYG